LRREIIINVEPNETRIGIKEDGELVEFMVERPGDRLSVGDIYKARVTAVLPGMQAAFLDIGYDRSAFLHVSDLSVANRDLESIEERFEGRDSRDDRAYRRGRNIQIEKILSKGDEIVVQVTKEPIMTKGPRVTNQISIPGRYMVLMPNADLLGVSRKIEEREERQRLKEMVGPLKPKGMGLIIRTVGEDMDRRHFSDDIKYLTKLWKKLDKRIQRGRVPSLIHKDMELITRLIRDVFTEDVTAVVVDSKQEYKEIVSYLRSYAPDLRSRVHLYKEDTPIFDAYEIERETEKILNRIVPLKKGGFICIDHTEALVAIDVNTGRYRGAKDQEETALKTNLQAAREVARQLRLRDMGGIIVIDFIDMELEENRKKVIDEFRNGLRRDRSRTKTLRVSEIGLVEMTRQRVRPSLGQMLSETCPVCGGSGRTLSLESIEMRLERALKRLRTRSRVKGIEVYLSPEVAFHMLSDGASRIIRMEKRFRMEIDVKDDPNLRRDEFVAHSTRKGEVLTHLMQPWTK
jgi:ribonuclease G